MKLTAIIERDGDGYVSLCPELDIAAKVTLLSRQGIIGIRVILRNSFFRRDTAPSTR